MATGTTRLPLLFSATCFLVFAGLISATNFDQCQVKVQNALDNGTLKPGSPGDPIYHGPIRGITSSQRPLLLTLDGCRRWCGSITPQFSSSVEAFEILTTWVLPVITLLSSLPYESTSRHGLGNFEAFVNWIGAPAATLSTTLWNIRMMHKCRIWARKPHRATEKGIVNDTLYILSCINQYEYPRLDPNKRQYLRRDRALLRATLFPYLDQRAITDMERQHLANTTQHLAFQLRLLRRRGVYPLAFGMFWFFLSLIFSIVISFDTSLGNNSEAHSLALGLLLAWLPVLVFTAYLDRNPVSSMRCAIIIERWLREVESLFNKRSKAIGAEHTDTSSSTTPKSPPGLTPDATSNSKRGADEAEQALIKLSSGREIDKINVQNNNQLSEAKTRRSTELLAKVNTEVQIGESELLSDYSDANPFKIGKFIGQGRKIRYCAVTDTILSMIMDEDRLCRLATIQDAKDFQADLPRRPLLWYVIWCLSFAMVAVGFTTAFVVTYQTPPIGIGCRCLSYLIWYAPSTISWVLLGIYQEPGPIVRVSMLLANTFATVVLIAIMLLQVTNGLNNCWCKAVTFVPELVPAYMDFDDGKWFQAASYVRETWGVATVFGLLGSVGALIWLTYGYEKDKSLWHVDEDREIDQVDGVPLDWLR